DASGAARARLGADGAVIALTSPVEGAAVDLHALAGGYAAGDLVDGGDTTAFRWAEGGAVTALDAGDADGSRATSVSADGWVGGAVVAAEGEEAAAVWSQAGALEVVADVCDAGGACLGDTVIVAVAEGGLFVGEGASDDGATWAFHGEAGGDAPA